MAMRGGGAASLTTPCAAPQARHLGGSAGFIDKNELGGIKIELPVKPRLARRFHIFALLFARVRCLLLSVMHVC